MSEIPKQFSSETQPDTSNLSDLTNEQLQADVDDFIDHSHEYTNEDLYRELTRYIEEIDQRDLPSEHPLSEWKRVSLPHLNRLNPKLDVENLQGGRYGQILDEVYTHGGELRLPELEVFGVDEVDVEAIKEFSLDLVNFIENKEQGAEEEELRRLYDFGQNIQATLFSASPSLVNYLHLPDRLKIMTRATRSEVVQRTFGSVFVGQTVYDLSFMEGNLDEITKETMEDLSIPEKLDLLHQLRTIGAQAIANGQWSRPAFNQVKQTYESLMNSEDSTVFVQLAAEAGLETLDAEYANPQLGAVRFEGQTSDSRLDTRFSNDQVENMTDKFFSKYDLDKVVSNSTKVLPATKDALVCMDRSGLASGIIRMDVEQFLASPESGLDFNVNQYRIYKQHTDEAKRIYTEVQERFLGKSHGDIANEYQERLNSADNENDTAKIIEEANRLFFKPKKRAEKITLDIYHALYNEYAEELVANGDTEEAAKIFAEMLPVLNQEDWQAYFIGETKRREYPSQNELYQEAAENNEKASYEFVTGLFDHKEKLGEKYQEYYQELEAALENQDYQYAFEMASNITLRAHSESLDMDAEETRMREFFEESYGKFHENDEAEQKDALEKIIREMREKNSKIQANIDQDGALLRRKVASLQQELRETHQENFEAGRQKYASTIQEFEQTEEMKARAEVVQKLRSGMVELSDQLSTFVESKLAKTQDLPQLELTSLQELVAEIKGDESLERVTDEDVLLFQHVHSGELAGKIESEFGFSLSDLSLKEQYFFLNYLKRVKPVSADLMKQFTSLYGVTGMRTFLSLERGDETLGDQIVSFGSHNENAAQVFSSYGALLDETEKVEQLIRSEVDCEQVDCNQLAQVTRERLLGETQKYLTNAVKSEEEDIVTGLSERSVEAKALSAAFTSYLSESGDVSIEQLNSFHKESYTGNEINDEKRAELERIYADNYRQLGYRKESIQELVAALSERLQDDSTKIRSWDFGAAQTLAFAATTEDESQKTAYVSGLNVNPELKSAQAARSLLDEIVNKYKEKQWTVNAETSPRNFQGYAEMGWVATKRQADELGEEQYLLDMSVMPDKEFASKELSRKELRERVSDNYESVGEDGVLVWKTNDPTATPPQLDEGYVLTRSLTVRGKNGQPDQYIFALESMTPSTTPQMQNAA